MIPGPVLTVISERPCRDSDAYIAPRFCDKLANRILLARTEHVPT